MNKASILIVEDEAIVAADLAGMLGRLGYEVIATTGFAEEALAIAREQRPDLVLMDIRLAGAMDGVEAAGIIHRELDLPVIFLTAHSDQGTLERAKLAEPFGYLLKPFEELGLETHIEMALYKHSAELKLRQAHDELELRVEERTRELQEAEQELRMVNETLEQRVAERTAELQIANAKLLDSRRAALNMMEDAVAARRQAEEASLEMQREAAERRQAEERLWVLARTLKALNNSSQALLHATDELSLLQAVCRIVIEDCGQAMVWIGFAEEDEEKSVRPAASAGFEAGYLETLGISWADTERGRGPTGTAIRTGKPCRCADMLSDPALEPWRDEARKRGYASSLVLPLMGDGKAYGAISIYSAKPHAFAEEETDLLMQLADELSYGIRTLRLRVAHEQAEEMLNAYYRRQNLLADTAGRLLAADSPQQIVDSLCQKVMEFLDCNAFFNFLVDEKEGRLHLNACAGIPDEEKQKIEWLDYGVAVCGCAARDACRIVAEDIPATHDPRTELVKSYGIKAYACHPLMVQGRVLGTLSFGTRNRTSFNDSDLSLMKAVTDQVAIAMERKRAEESLRLAKEAAETANQTKSQFLANMSHELRTPMTGVLGMLDLAIAGHLEDQQREFIDTARKSAASLLRILNDILDLTKFEVGKLTMEENTFSLPECLAGTVDILMPEARRKGLNLTLSITDNVPATVVGDQLRLQQVLTNLIANAVKFTDQGKVEVRVDADCITTNGKREITFSIVDTGIGIPEDKKNILFKPFSQVDSSDTRRYGGTGLGLAISREIVERMSGTITCENHTDLGSNFSFTVPLGEAATVYEPTLTAKTTVHQESSPQLCNDGRKPRLLLAEDDATIRRLLETMLRLSNFETENAENGQKAVDMWKHGDFDLILMDVQMPVMDGFSATRAIREMEESRGGHTLIVAMTAHALKKDELRCLEAGMDAYISKPVDLKASIALIKELISQQNQA